MKGARRERDQENKADRHISALMKLTGRLQCNKPKMHRAERRIKGRKGKVLKVRTKYLGYNLFIN